MAAATSRDIGDMIYEILEFCFSAEHQPALEAAAVERDNSLHQLVAASIAMRLEETFVISHRKELGRHGLPPMLRMPPRL